jgi:hypothetical protein
MLRLCDNCVFIYIENLGRKFALRQQNRTRPYYTTERHIVKVNKLMVELKRRLGEELCPKVSLAKSLLWCRCDGPPEQMEQTQIFLSRHKPCPIPPSATLYKFSRPYISHYGN